jgi:hypothetical protein
LYLLLLVPLPLLFLLVIPEGDLLLLSAFAPSPPHHLIKQTHMAK